MARLGYDRYGAQGGDWGSAVTTRSARRHARAAASASTSTWSVAVPAVDGRRLDRRGAARRSSADDALPATGARATRPSSRPGRRRSATASPTPRPARPPGSSRSSGPGPTTTAIPRTRCSRRRAARQRDALLAAPAPPRRRRACTGRASAHFRDTDPVDVPSGLSIYPHEISRPSRRWAELRFTDIRHWSEHDRAAMRRNCSDRGRRDVRGQAVGQGAPVPRLARGGGRGSSLTTR